MEWRDFFENKTSNLILTVESNSFACMQFLGLVLHTIRSENILSTIVLLTGVIRQVSAYLAWF